MAWFTVQRLLSAIPTILGVTIVVFIALRVLPGDPVTAVLGDVQATPEMVDAIRAQFGLDKPLVQQYLDFLAGVLTFDLGTSFSRRMPVSELILNQMWPTFGLALAAALVSATVGITLGSIAALRKGTWVDSAVRVLSVIANSMPSFWVGLLLLMIFSLRLGWFPATGNRGIESLVLPATALGMAAAGTVTRVVRNSVAEVLTEPFVLAQHAKGLPGQIVLVKHVLRNAIVPTVTIIGMQIGGLIAGSVIVETVFSRQGLGQLLNAAITNNDFPVIQGVVLVVAMVYIVVNLIVDLSYAVLDPRVRVGRVMK